MKNGHGTAVLVLMFGHGDLIRECTEIGLSKHFNTCDNSYFRETGCGALSAL